MEILEEDEQRLDLALPEQEPPDRVQGSLTALGQGQGLPCGIVHGDVQQRQERRQERLQRPVQRQELAGDALADLPRAVALLDPAIRLQELDDG